MPAKKNHTYVVDTKLSKTARAANYLDWFAKTSPGSFVAFNEIVKQINGYSRMPMLKGEETEQLRRNTHSIRKQLKDNYGREMISLPGVGVRATTDDADVLKNVVPKKANRLQSARSSFVTTVNSIDQTALPNTAEMAPLKAWLGREIASVMKQIGSAEFERKLLPPAPPTAEEKASTKDKAAA